VWSDGVEKKEKRGGTEQAPLFAMGKQMLTFSLSFDLS
jgi:hypothetical protein